MKYFIFLYVSLVTLVSVAQPTGQRYQLQRLTAVSTGYHEAAPVISPDGNTLYFFVQNHPQNTYGVEGTQDIWLSKKGTDGSWSAAVHAPSPLNAHHLNQVFNVFQDGTLLVRGGKAKNSSGFSLVGPSGNWRELKVIDFEAMNKGRFYGAAMSADQKHLILYFSEVQGSTKSDLYISHVQGDGSWTRPVKLMPSSAAVPMAKAMSTPADEFGQFIAPDQKTLFFASDRVVPGRQGAIDMYKVTRLDESWNVFSEPVNLGKPLNTSAEDDYFSMDNSGNVFTARSLNKGGGGNLDIFVLVPKNISILLEGDVFDASNRQPLTLPIEVMVEVMVKDHPVLKVKSDGTGKFSTKVAEGTQYSVTVSAEGYEPFAQNFPMPRMNGDSTLHVEVLMKPIRKPMVVMGTVTDAKTGAVLDPKMKIQLKSTTSIFDPVVSGGAYRQEVSSKGVYMFTVGLSGYLNLTDSIEYRDEQVTPVVKDLKLTPIEVGAVVRLRNIYFDYDRTTLKRESFVELEKVVAFLKENPSVEIEIQGHTDSNGSDSYNLNLSQGRSQSVVDYLISKGIVRTRLSAKGFGETKPIDTNETDGGRANNRRVEFTVTKK